MNISKITDAVTRVGGRQLLKVQKHSPEILVVGGVVGVVAAGVMLVRATNKAQPAIRRFKEGVEVLSHQSEEIKAGRIDPDYDVSQHRKDVLYFARGTARDFTVLYGPAITVGAGSVVAILAGHRILQGRHVALAAAYKGLEFTFDEYRKRVATHLGEEKEQEVYRGLVKHTKVNEETGKKITLKEYSRNGMSQYSRFFDEFNKNYISGRPDQNKSFLLAQEKYLTQKLHARGHLFLNEVYDALGMERSPEGQIVGWVYGSENGDGYVSFGLDDPTNEMMRMFVNGLEDAVLIDFNVDGPVWSLI